MIKENDHFEVEFDIAKGERTMPKKSKAPMKQCCNCGKNIPVRETICSHCNQIQLGIWMTEKSVLMDTDWCSFKISQDRFTAKEIKLAMAFIKKFKSPSAAKNLIEVLS